MIAALVLAIVPAVVAFLLSRSLTRLRIGRLIAANHRGQRLPVVLGVAMGTAVVSACLGLLLAIAISGRWSAPAGQLSWVAMAFLAVGAVGFVDDLVSGGPRGLRGHVGALRSGGVSSGLLKVLVITAAALGVSSLTLADRGVLPVVLGTIITAASANIWNGLDVAPGRAGKYFFVAAVPIILADYRNPAWLVLIFCVGAEIGVFAFDLRERGMLGDAGANILGFGVGAALAPGLSTSGLVIAAVVAVGLNVLAETFTFSRVISGVPPLRWVDRLGRLPAGPRFSPN